MPWSACSSCWPYRLDSKPEIHKLFRKPGGFGRETVGGWQAFGVLEVLSGARWYDTSPYFNLPFALCKRVPPCVLSGRF